MPTSLLRHFSGAPDCFVLTHRQRQVAALVARGATNREIGHALCLSERSVETYVSAILGRLGIRSRTQLAIWALQHGLAAGDRGVAPDLNHIIVPPRLSGAHPRPRLASGRPTHAERR
jgi:DNA-binding CsgD family transcriptional regulator